MISASKFNSPYSIIETLYRAASDILKMKKNMDLYQYIYVMSLSYGYSLLVTTIKKKNCFKLDISMPPSIKSSDRIFLTPGGPRLDDPTEEK